MDILFASMDLDPPKGGAEISAMELLQHLGNNHKITAISMGKKDESYRKGKVSVIKVKTPSWVLKLRSHVQAFFANILWGKVLEKHIMQNKPDLIMTQLSLTSSTVEVAKKQGIPVIVFIRSQEVFYLNTAYGGKPKKQDFWQEFFDAPLAYKAQAPFYFWVRKWNRKAMRDADMIIANSEFFKSLCRHAYGRDSEIIYPPIDLKKFTANKRSGKYISMIKPIPSKGADVFVEMARRFSKEKFLAVGGSLDNAPENVVDIRWTNNLKDDVYSKTKLMLMPSRVNESFGRMAVEAMANGIPCIASDRGGVADIVKDVWPTADPDDYDAWERHIKRLLSDNKAVSEGVKGGKLKIRKYDYSKQLKKMDEIVERFSK